MSNSKHKNRTLKFKIIIMALSIIIFSSTAISALVYLKTLSNNKTNAINTVQDKVDIINERLNSLTEETVNIANLLSASNVLRTGLAEADENILYSELEKYSKQYPEIVNFVFNRNDKAYIYPRNAEAEKILAERGRPDQKDYYKTRAAEKEDGNWTATYTDDASGNLIVTYYQKIYEGGQHIGFIEIDLSLAHIKDLVQETHIGENDTVLITDYAGLVNLSTGSDELNKNISNETLLNFVSSTDNGTLTYKDEKEDKFAVVKKLNSKINWKLVAEIPSSEIAAESKAFLVHIIISALIIGIIGIAVSMIMSERIVKNIRQFNENLNQLGQGDLTTYCTITSNDELSEMCDVFNVTIEKVRDLIKSTQETCSNLLEGFSDMSHKSKENTQAINLIVESIQEIAEGATEQASETTRIANHFGELSGAMKYIDKSLVEINEMVSSTQETNNSGLTVVNNLLEVTKVTNESNDKVRNSITNINQTSSQIDNIIKSIDKMAEDAKLLNTKMLNENSNSAVAGEVNKLSNNLSNSAKEVKDLITKVKSQTKIAVSEMENAKEKAKLQTDAVKETGESFNSLNKDINKLNTHVKNIGVLNNNMIIIKNTMTEIIDKLATKADINSEATQSISAMTEEQLATMLEIDEHLIKLTNASEYLKKEISKFKTRQE